MIFKKFYFNLNFLNYWVQYRQILQKFYFNNSCHLFFLFHSPFFFVDSPFWQFEKSAKYELQNILCLHTTHRVTTTVVVKSRWNFVKFRFTIYNLFSFEFIVVGGGYQEEFIFYTLYFVHFKIYFVHEMNVLCILYIAF